MSIITGLNFRRLKAGKDRLPASEWNKAVDRLEALLRSNLGLGFASSGGLSFRRVPIPSLGSVAAYARIVQTLQREDVELGHDKINWYEIELLSLKMQEWASNHGVYYIRNLVKYQSKIYECKIEHNASVSFPPTVTSHWKEATNTKAWVFGYSGDLIEGDHWLQVDDIVEVIRYADPRWPDRNYWIMESVQRIQEGSGENIVCSLYWNEIDGRAMSVYR